MGSWKQGGTVLRALGAREQEGLPKPELTPGERKVVQKRFARKREGKISTGKRSYQPSVC